MQSRVLHICAGVRQSGILSPLMFAVYIDGLVQNVESSGFGCWIHVLFVFCILCADDVILLAQTTFAMQKMLDICISEITALDLYFNVSKFVVMRVGPRWNKPYVAFDLGGSALKFTDSIKYLGIYLEAGRKFGCSYDHLKMRFYGAFIALYCRTKFNALYCSTKSSNSELVSVKLLKSFFTNDIICIRSYIPYEVCSGDVRQFY